MSASQQLSIHLRKANHSKHAHNHHDTLADGVDHSIAVGTQTPHHSRFTPRTFDHLAGAAAVAKIEQDALEFLQGLEAHSLKSISQSKPEVGGSEIWRALAESTPKDTRSSAQTV